MMPAAHSGCLISHPRQRAHLHFHYSFSSRLVETEQTCVNCKEFKVFSVPTGSNFSKNMQVWPRRRRMEVEMEMDGAPRRRRRRRSR